MSMITPASPLALHWSDLERSSLFQNQELIFQKVVDSVVL